MKKYQKYIVCAALLFSSILPAAEKKFVWSEDYLQARKTAAEKKLPMLLLFSGSDWCPPCIRLDKTVLDTKEFAAYAKKGKFVFFKADFPRRRRIAEKISRQNNQLMQTYQVRGVPTVVLTDPDGREFARTGYRPGGVEKYIKHLDELLKKNKK